MQLELFIFSYLPSGFCVILEKTLPYPQLPKILYYSKEVDTIMYYHHLQMRNFRHREIKKLAQGNINNIEASSPCS